MNRKVGPRVIPFEPRPFTLNCLVFTRCLKAPIQVLRPFAAADPTGPNVNGRPTRRILASAETLAATNALGFLLFFSRPSWSFSAFPPRTFPAAAQCSSVVHPLFSHCLPPLAAAAVALGFTRLPHPSNALSWALIARTQRAVMPHCENPRRIRRNICFREGNVRFPMSGKFT